MFQPTFVTAATGDLPPKTGTNLTFNSSSGLLTSTLFAGDITGDVTGMLIWAVTGSIVTAAQGNITSVGTLTGLTIANDGNIGSAGDTDAIIFEYMMEATAGGL